MFPTQPNKAAALLPRKDGRWMAYDNGFLLLVVFEPDMAGYSSILHMLSDCPAAGPICIAAGAN